MYALADSDVAIQEFFTATADEVARETRFVVRTSKVSGAHWLQVWVFGFLETEDATLNQLAQVSTDLGVALGAQGLDNRLSRTAVAFMQQMFEKSWHLFRTQTALPVGLLKRFVAVHVIDSTHVALPDAMAALFPACGGDGPVAGLKVQLLLDLCTGRWGMTLEAANQPDQTAVAPVRALAGSLRIGDLGYFNTAAFRTLAEAQAYFLSRLAPTATPLDPETEATFDLVAWLRRQDAPLTERAILLGQQEHLPCRLIAQRLPQDVVDTRRRKARANARRKGRTLSAATVARLAWGLYVTNVPTEKLSAEEVGVLYRVRWQIELVFKVWKSEARLAQLGNWRSARILCEVYAKLIGLVLVQLWSAPMHSEDWEGELSLTKVFQIAQRHAVRLAQGLASLPQLHIVLTALQAQWKRFARKEKRQKSPSTLRILQGLSQA